jgi:hypothetical protein
LFGVPDRGRFIKPRFIFTHSVPSKGLLLPTSKHTRSCE